MERWTALLPDRTGPHGTAAGPGHPAARPRPRLLGRLPEPAWIVVAHFLPVPDLPQLALASRALARIVADDRVWRTKLAWLDYHGPQPHPTDHSHNHRPDHIRDQDDRDDHKDDGDFGEQADDDFGDFLSTGPAPSGPATAGHGVYGDWTDTAASDPDPFGLAEDFGHVALQEPTAALAVPPQPSRPPADDLLLALDDDSPAARARPPARPRPTVSNQLSWESSARNCEPPPPGGSHLPEVATASAPPRSEPLIRVFQTYHAALLPYYTSLKTHTTSSLVFTHPSLTPLQRARLLATLARFCHPLLAPTRSLPQRLAVLRNVQSAMDFFESTLLADFQRADAASDEDAMRERARIIWEVNQSPTVAQVFVQKRENLFGSGHNPLRNLTKIETPSGAEADGIDFSAMDHFMASVLDILQREGSLIARVFPPAADVLLYFLERIANDVVSDYITTLLSAAQALPNPLFLLATAATFGQVYRLVDQTLAIEPRNEELVTRARAEDIIFRVFEPLMDDYLAEEGEWIRQVLEGICAEWDRKTASAQAVSDPTFLASQNPAQVKKNVLAGFTKVLLLPVTIIPKTAMYGVNAITYGGTAVIDTFAQLGTQLAGAGAGMGAGGSGTRTPNPAAAAATRVATGLVESEASPAAVWGGDGSAPRLSIDAHGTVSLPDGSALAAAAPTPTRSTAAPSRHFDRLQLLLSLDTALQLLQADRDSLKRIQTFQRFPGLYGRKVRDALEEVFIVLLQVLHEKHVGPAFDQARRQMERYRPADDDAYDSDEEVNGAGAGGGGGGGVAPLVQFFELVHIGDTIQQMVDVYFEKEMAAYLDRRDFLNVVVREKKRFEAALDDAVAQGLNAAVNILMAQVEHLVSVRQGLRDFTPVADGADLDLTTPTRACRAAVRVLRQHCEMLQGSTDKHILEVFNQEVGIRLFGILLKHIKRQIISTAGGLQLLADLNAYHGFITSLRQPAVTAYFTSLKLVGEIYLVEAPKDLGALVRDTTRYDGVLSPEDLYELVQRRADWKRIERDVDKALFGFKVADDCVVS